MFLMPATAKQLYKINVMIANLTPRVEEANVEMPEITFPVTLDQGKRMIEALIEIEQVLDNQVQIQIVGGNDA
jgi:hypothetical protein